MAGKGSKRRKEDTKKVEANLAKVKPHPEPDRKRPYKVRINGVLKHDV